MKHEITVTINGERKTASVSADMTLLELIRTGFRATGTKRGCGNGECGACTIIMDGEAVRSCLILAVEADGKNIVTIEGVSKGGSLTILQKAFLEEGAVQCGFCTPGFIMAGEALFNKNPNAGEKEILEALSGHLCRCTGYESIFAAFNKAAKIYNAKKSTLSAKK